MNNRASGNNLFKYPRVGMRAVLLRIISVAFKLAATDARVYTRRI